LGFEYRILGPLEAARDGEALRLGGRKQRMLLALLVVEAGAPVSPDRLIEALWQDYDPAAPGRLQVMVSLLRRALGDREAITLRNGGYVLAADAIDGSRFEALAQDGAAALASGEPERAAATLREALGLWRGPRSATWPASRACAPPPAGSKRCAWSRWRGASRLTSRSASSASWCPNWKRWSPSTRCASACTPR
jgi:DNA-binding SARP family transcriptional activator